MRAAKNPKKIFDCDFFGQQARFLPVSTSERSRIDCMINLRFSERLRKLFKHAVGTISIPSSFGFLATLPKYALEPTVFRKNLKFKESGEGFFEDNSD